MDKDNVFRSSDFHMDDGDILHMITTNESGSRTQIGLYGASVIAEGLATTPLISYTDVRDGAVYTEIMMGNQIWMKENFAYNFAGSLLQNVAYGRLYTNTMVLDVSFPPAGWHVPTTAEWDALISFCGGNQNALNMKSSDTYWFPNGIGTNFGGMDIRGGGYDKAGYSREKSQAWFGCNTGAGEAVIFDGSFSVNTLTTGSALWAGAWYISCRLIKN